jgi:hypothetical protein
LALSDIQATRILRNGVDSAKVVAVTGTNTYIDTAPLTGVDAYKVVTDTSDGLSSADSNIVNITVANANPAAAITDLAGTLTGGGGTGGAGDVVITIQPANQASAVGGTATFAVTATGTQPLSYQWSKNGAPIAGATTASYTTPVLVASDNGAVFSVTVRDSTGSMPSAAATVSVG